jgi:hypothetical protein
MLEKNVEQSLMRQVKEIGGLCWKWVSPGRSGVPDRIVILPTGETIYVELKAPGKKPTPLQIHCHEQLRYRGARVEVLDSIEAVKEFIRGLSH